jgi:WD40 repeat protein
VNIVALSSDGKSLVSVDTDGLALIWDTQTWRRICRVEGLPAMSADATLSSNGKYLIVSGRNLNSAMLFEIPGVKRSD